MLTFAVVSLPFTSHILALEAVAVELLSRGHRVTWIGPVDVLDSVRDRRITRAPVGLGTHPAGSRVGVVNRAARPGGPWGLRRVIADMSAASGMLCREGRQILRDVGAQAVLTDQMEAAGGLLAESVQLPWISVACALPINREAHVPLPVMHWGYATDTQGLHRNAISARVHDWFMGSHSEAIRRQSLAWGLTEQRSLTDGLSPLLQLSQTTRGFDFPRQHLPDHFHHVGALRAPLSSEPAIDVAVQAGRPFVFASLGTLQGGRLGLFRRIAAACRSIDAQLLVAHCGRLDAAQSRQLEHAGATWVTDFAPQRAVLARADALVTHAGLNTVLDALVAGTPMLALPIAFDQPGVAARVVHAGAGLRLQPALASRRAVQRSLQRLLADTAFRQRAAALGSEVSAAGGAPRAADLIEQALGCTAAKGKSGELAHAC